MKKFVPIAMMFCGVFANTEPGPGISIRNKALEDISVNIVNGPEQLDEEAMARFYVVPSGALAKRTIDIELYTSLTIKNHVGVEVKKCHFKAGKTLYLNWDGHKLYPQRGPFSGRTKKTDEGYSLENNITKDQMICDISSN